MTEQLVFDLDAAVRSLLADRLQDRRRISGAAGAERLLRDLVQAGLDEKALLPAAALVAELDEPRSTT